MNIHKDKNSLQDFNENETTIDLKKYLIKYLRFWPWFLVALIISLIIAVTYLHYVEAIYVSEAKVQLIDDNKNSNFSLDISKVFSKTTVNLENEIALFKSYHLSERVVKNLKLNVVYICKGKINSKVNYDPPFEIIYRLPEDSLVTPIDYDITITETGYTVIDNESGKSFKSKGYWFNTPVHDFPITIQPSHKQNLALFADSNYEVILKPIKLSSIELSNEIQVEPTGKESDIVSLVLKSSDGKQTEKILNNLIKVFEDEGIKDNQAISKKTIDFVNDRFVYLKKELDVIELSKKEYKKSNNLSFIEGDAQESIKMKSEKEQALFEMDSQLLLIQLLQKSLIDNNTFELLPADIGIQNSTIDPLIKDYNMSVLEYQRLKSSAGMNNPTLQVLVNTIITVKKNIENSVSVYKKELETSRNLSQLAQRNAEGSFSSLPEKEKILRNMDRQQNLKESLYLLLLQKREEASINLAIAVPNTKIIDFAITNNKPISPKKSIVILVALCIGLFIPFGILYILFKYDDKIYNADDLALLNTGIPVIGELPSSNHEKFLNKETDLEIMEAFRTLAHNSGFVTPFTDDGLGKVYFVTSSIKGEGKTFVSFNLCTAFAQLDKKIILVGSDLRNPQLHKYLNQFNHKINKGLSNYLSNNSLNWKDLIYKNEVDDYTFDVLLSGDIPPNPLLLLSNQRLGTLIGELKLVYDIIIFDTAPTLLVSDSLVISKFADTTLYVMRSGVTEKKLVSYSSKLNETKKLVNMGYIINDIDVKSGYNYGHSYSYDNHEEKRSLFKRIFKIK